MFTTRPELKGTFGAVASSHWLGTSVGMAVLEKGGNAFDAAVAAGFVLQIVEPHLNGPGGEVPIIFQAAHEKAPRVLCGQGVAPIAATVERFQQLGLTAVPGTGLLAAVVPGAFDAWMCLLRDYGTLPLDEILGYAVHYAGSGFPLVRRAVESIAVVADFFRSEWPTSAEVWLPNGNLPVPDSLYRTPTIAQTYKKLLEQARSCSSSREGQIEAARNAFYRGFVAEEIDRFCRLSALLDTSGRRHGGLLTADDMGNWEASYEPTVHCVYGGMEIHKTGPWGQGPVLLQQMALLEYFDLSAMDHLGAEFVHHIVECSKLAFADREVFYGDPKFVDVPIDMLLNRSYADQRHRLISQNASLVLRPGELPGASERLVVALEAAGREQPRGPGTGEPTFAELPAVRGDTVHLDVVDRHGNMVSATPSGGWLQSSPVVPRLGFCLNTRAQMFALDRRLPSIIAPGKRPRTTLSPTLVCREGIPIIAIGTPGGDQQDQWTLTVLLRHVHHGLNLQAAIDAPLFHSRHFPASFFPHDFEPGRVHIENRFSKESLDELESRGHNLKVEGPWSLGRVCAVARDSEGMLRAAATPRFMQGYAIAR